MIKISTLNSSLHESKRFDESVLHFIHSIEIALGEPIVPAELSDYDCDLKLIFISSGGSEGKFLAAIHQLKQPYIILTQGTNNSLAASLEILTYINNHGLEGEVLHGTVDYISSRIQNLLQRKSKTTKSCKSVATIGKQVNMGKHYGVVGKPSDWLIASVPDYAKVKENFGVTLTDYSLEPIASSDEFSRKEQVGEELDIDSSKLCATKIQNYVDQYALDGLTIRCFDLLSTVHTTGCLGLANLNTNGILGVCEGDIMAMLSMGIVKQLTGQSSFQCNPSVIDNKDNTIVLAHCTIPYDMLTDYHYETHFESKIGVAIKGYLKETNVTLFRLSDDLEHYFVAEGTIIENLESPDLCRTQIKVKVDDAFDISELLRRPCGNHHIVFYGKHKQEIDAYLGGTYEF